jgi:hypothetical protein
MYLAEKLDRYLVLPMMVVLNERHQLISEKSVAI